MDPGLTSVRLGSNGKDLSVEREENTWYSNSLNSNTGTTIPLGVSISLPRERDFDLIFAIEFVVM